MHVFISYAREDAVFADALCQSLNHNIPYWIDTKDIGVGGVWREEIREAIQASFAVIVIMTEASHRSEWVQAEIRYARQNHIPIIPILHSGPMWQAFEELNYIEMRATMFFDVPVPLYQTLQELRSRQENRLSRQHGFKNTMLGLVLLAAIMTITILMTLVWLRLLF